MKIKIVPAIILIILGSFFLIYILQILLWEKGKETIPDPTREEFSQYLSQKSNLEDYWDISFKEVTLERGSNIKEYFGIINFNENYMKTIFNSECDMNLDFFKGPTIVNPGQSLIREIKIYARNTDEVGIHNCNFTLNSQKKPFTIIIE